MNVSHLVVLIGLVGVLAAVAALWVVAVVSILRAPTLPGWGIALWVLAALAFPVLGPIAWFAMGRPRGSSSVALPQ